MSPFILVSKEKLLTKEAQRQWNTDGKILNEE
jgi:hypothetical protein